MAMHRELDVELQALPRYQLAARHRRLLKKILVVCWLVIACFMVILWFGLWPGLQPVIVAQTAALLLLSASLQSVGWITAWRIAALRDASQKPADIVNQDLQGQQTHVPEQILKPLVSPSRFTLIRTSLSVRWLTFFASIQRPSQALTTLATLIIASVALFLVINYWNVQAGDLQAGGSQVLGDLQRLLVGQVPARFLVIMGLLLAAFAALVLERYFNHMDTGEAAARTLPEAPHIVYLLRVYITLSLLLSLVLLLANGERQWPLSALVWMSVLPAVIAVEFLLRAVLSVFAPPQQHEPELLSKSRLAEELWRWPIKPFAHLQDELKQHFGIDLRQSWAFAYIRRSLVAVLGILLGIAWLLSGLVEIPMAERGIYERFGAPTAVWQPGIHTGLPWPFGRVQRMENGVVHELSATPNEKEGKDAKDEKNKGNERNEKNEKDTAEQAEVISAEGAPPVTANRLWDASHLAEKSQIIASEVTTADGTRQSFHIVNMDVRFMYRIGLTDSAALKARYTSANTQALIRSTANRILVRYFASRTLEGVLGEARTQMAKEIGSQLQADLDALNSGVEIMTTVLEAIHPPAAAANAYHAVQAAQIKAHAIISRERGNAAQEINLAQVRATIARNQASASARDTLATAEVANRRFSAERDAYQQGGKAFLMEQYFAQLTMGLKNAQVLLVDHRLPNMGATLDLRGFSDVGKSATSGTKTLASPALAPNVDYQESP
jgi:regulator of protease activity HflC (stomatin/prohibitin superfamily)